jgi:ParB family chromosome partitioning protein
MPHFVPVEQIAVIGRLRPIDQSWAALLAENIGTTGRLRHPIELRPRPEGGYQLVAGAHRLRAAQLLGWDVIPAVVIQVSDDQARLAEIDENLIRHELNPLDRAVFLAERKVLYERLYPQARRGGDRGNQHTGGRQTDTVSFSQDTAERCGLTDRTIRRAVMIAEKLPQPLRHRLAGTPLAHKQSELLALAKLPPEEQQACVDLLLGQDSNTQTVAEAHKRVVGQRPDQTSEDSAQLTVLLSKWRRTSRAARRQFLAHLQASGQIEALLGIGPETRIPPHLQSRPYQPGDYALGLRPTSELPRTEAELYQHMQGLPFNRDQPDEG